MKRLLSVLVSIAVLLGALAFLRLWLDSLAEMELRVEAIPGPGVLLAPVTMREVGRDRRPAHVEVDGEEVAVPGGAETGTLVLDSEALGPGLHLVTWDAEYLGHAPRQASFSFLAGPFATAGRAPCAIRVSLGEEVLERIGHTLEGTVTEAVESIGGLPGVERARVHVTIVEGGLDATADVDFKGTSTLWMKVPLKIEVGENAAIRLVQRAPVEARATGSVATAAIVTGGGILAGLSELFKHPTRGIAGAVAAARRKGREKTEHRAERAFAEHLPDVNARLAHALPTRISAKVLDTDVDLRLSACGAPATLPGRAIVLRYDARVRIRPGRKASPPADAEQVPGPIASRALPPLDGPPKGALTLEVSESLLNVFLDAAWRSGALASVAADPALIGRLNSRLSYAADFRLDRIALDLPPVITLGEGGARLAAGEVAVTLVDEKDTLREMVVAADGRVRGEVSSGWISVDLAAGRVLASCSTARDGGVVRSPCYPDLVEALNRAARREGTLRRLFAGTVRSKGATVRITKLSFLPGALVLEGGLALDPSIVKEPK